MHLFNLYDASFLRWAALFLSSLGILKTNFLTDIFLQAPNGATNIDVPFTYAPDLDIATTQYIISQMT